MLGFAAAGNNIGGVVFVQISTAVVESHDFRLAARIFACVHLALAAVYVLTVRDFPRAVDLAVEVSVLLIDSPSVSALNCYF